MSEKVEPALTPRDWAQVREEAQVAPDGIISTFFEERDFHVDIPSPPDERHAWAALCLHGQPFGFDWEDVDALRELVRVDYDPEVTESWPEGREWHRTLSSLAARIAALLPPRPVDTP